MKRKDWFEVLGTLGMIAGLIFVGAEIRQSTIATRAATLQEVKSSWLDFNLVVASSPELGAAIQKGEELGWDSLASSERFMISGFYRSLFQNWSNAYAQYRLGTLDPEEWAPQLRDAAPLAQDPLGLEVWELYDHVFDDHFQALMDSLIAAGG